LVSVFRGDALRGIATIPSRALRPEGFRPYSATGTQLSDSQFSSICPVRGVCASDDPSHPNVARFVTFDAGARPNLDPW